MRLVLRTLAVLAATGAVIFVAVVFGGLFNVSAKLGHLPGVSWVLHTTYGNAVELYAPSESDIPELSPEMAALGRGHFEGACIYCHAGAGEERNATVLSMVPPPPYIEAAVEGWGANHLWWILYNGVKMSGMPHWPSDREEEVWAVVAYLESVQAGAPAGLPNTPEVDDPTLAYCASCHGVEGRSGNGLIPRLDILEGDYMEATLMAYREGRRESGFMYHASRAVTQDELIRMAAYFDEIPPEVDPGMGGAPADLVEQGAELAQRGSREVPACVACHGPSASRGGTAIPDLAGQYEPYLRTQLTLWREGRRGGDARAGLMNKAAQDLTDEDIAALAAWYASLDPTGVIPR